MTQQEKEELLALIQETHALVVETRALAEEHIRIAREYKEGVGDPLKKLLYAVALIAKIIAYLIGAVLTFIGLREAWEVFLMNRFK